jgi:protein O-mannosyl-transferase
MAKKQVKPTPARKPSAITPPPVSKSPSSNNWSAWIPMLLAVGITALCYLGSFSTELVNWDDMPNITENKNLARVGQGQTWGETFRLIFDLQTGNVIGNYNPLPILTFAIEKVASGGEFNEDMFRMIHINNLILHLLVVFFAFRCLVLLGFGPWGAFVGALLMGIHPMRVESVAWATERKDVLFGAFYFAALEAYIRSVKAIPNGRANLYLLLSILLGILALFSKVQAVTLVVSMLVVDYWLRREWSMRIVTEKLILFAASIAMGLANIYTLNSQGSTDDSATGYSFIDRLCIACWSFCVYVYKLVIPYPMSPLYPYPKPIPSHIYASPILFIAFWVLIFLLWRRGSRIAVFASLFFFLNVAPVLQLFGAGQGYLADRFTYVPYFGFFALAAWAYHQYGQRESTGTLVKIIAGLFLTVFAYLTVQQVKIWQNGETLWSHVLPFQYDKEKGRYVNSLPFWNRGQYRREKGDYDRALADYTEAIKVTDKDPDLFISRGKTYFDLAARGGAQSSALNQKAIEDYTKAVERATEKKTDGKLSEALINRGAAFGMAGRAQEALNDLNQGIKVNPDNKNGYFNRSILHFQTQQYDKAIEDYTTYLKYEPYDANILYERGMLRRSLSQPNNSDPKQPPKSTNLAMTQDALNDLNLAIKYDPKFGLAFVERGRAQVMLGNLDAAKRDFVQARNLGIKLTPADEAVLNR